MRVAADLARAEVARALRGLGVPDADALGTAEVLIEAELDGVGSHGLARMPQYVQQLRTGALNARPAFRWEALRPGVATLYADHALGPVAALAATDAAVARARECGVGAVAVRGSGHVGPLSAYVIRAALSGAVALAFANTPPAMAAWGAASPVLGTNPIAIAAPGMPHPIVVDSSLTVAARGKILSAAKTGAPIPAGWAVDAHGRPTTDAKAALNGALLPAGDAKGYALSVLVEILAGVLAGDVLSAELPMPWVDPDKTSAPGFLLVAFAVDAFGDGAAFARRAAALRETIVATGGRVPGDRRWASRADQAAQGIEVGDALAGELERLDIRLAPPAAADRLPG